jgi:hypothetical protein
VHRVITALGFFLIAAIGAAFAPPARAEFEFMTPEDAQAAMEKHGVPGLFYFEVAGETPAVSYTFQFNQGPCQEVLKKFKYAVCKITATTKSSGGGGGGGGKRGGKGGQQKAQVEGWSGYDGLAKQLGVGKQTTLVCVASDMKVLGRKTEIIKREDFMAWVAKCSSENTQRKTLGEETARDLTQIEKWLEAKKFADANRRLGLVFDREGQVAAKLIDRAKELEGKFEDAGPDRVAEARRLVEQQKYDEARPILEDAAAAFAKFDCGKEARDLLKKCKANGSGKDGERDS